jgi:hypothetical protein
MTKHNFEYKLICILAIILCRLSANIDVTDLIIIIFDMDNII